jgi:DNA-binding transcriptional MerR regulator
MQQLDLFGNRINVKPEEKKPLEKKAAVRKDEGDDYINQAVAIAESFAADSVASSTSDEVDAPKPLEQIKEVIVDAPIAKEDSLIFTNAQIGVKIKPKAVVADPGPKPKIQKAARPEQKRGRKSFKEMDAEVDLIEIPEDDVLFQKQYYSISQVAEWFKVNTSLIRFWENEFDVLKPKKNRKGDRLFRPEDVKNLHLIYHLLRQRKYTIDGAKEFMRTNKDKADIQFKLTKSLEKIKGFLLDLRGNL